jgi:hypothetical protein
VVLELVEEEVMMTENVVAFVLVEVDNGILAIIIKYL